MGPARTVNVSAFVAPHPFNEDHGPLPPPALWDLTREMVRGDEPAWVRFHAAFSRRLHRYLLVLLRGDEDVAGELLQITFTRIARHIRPFNDELILWQWLARIARTVVIDERRKRGSQKAFLAGLEGSSTNPAPAENRWTDFLAEGLGLIAAEDRQLLSQKYFEGASVRTLAAQYQSSEKAVESKLVRARQKLRAAILELLKDEK